MSPLKIKLEPKDTFQFYNILINNFENTLEIQ